MASRKTTVPPSLQIKLLGEFCLTYSGNSITSVNGERLQAMLAFILLHRDTPQPRQQIAVQLWPEAPDAEAKANLRRRLYELRQLLPDADRFLQVTTKTLQWVNGTPYSLDVANFEIAIAQSKQAQQSTNLTEARQALEKAAKLYQGELLPSCYDDWLVPKREQLKQQAINGLDTLVTLLSEQGDSRTAIGYAQRLLRLDPLYEKAYCHLMRLHAQEGDRASALRVYHQCMTALREELGVNPSPVTCKIYEQLLTMEDVPTASTCVAVAKPLFSATTLPQVKTVSSSPPPHLPLIGRELEWATIQQWMMACRNKASSDLMLILGEPGIGKTRLLEELAQPIRDEGGYVLWGRGFEAEMLRPYGAWADAFRSIEAHEFLSELTSLLLDTTSSPSALDRGRLFDTAVEFITQLAENHAPVLVVLDDIQWLDETSIAFLHYVARLLSNVPVLFACAARKRELEDNVSAYKFWQAFHREHRVRVLELTPLDRNHTAELAHILGTQIDGDRVFTDSGGNPLFALEIARALSQSDSYSGNLETLIQGRLFQLHETARDLVPWAAALGRSFNPTTLAQVADCPLPRLLTAIAQLEQHSIIRPGTVIDGEIVYDFAHDIVRQVAYQQLSEPRRRLIHLHIAQALNALTTSDSALINDVAHHASLGGNHPLAASASLLAAERCLRVFAYAEASELAQRGIQHCQHLDKRSRVGLHLGLLRAYVKAGVTKERASTLQTELQRLINEASALGLKDEEATGLEALIVLCYEQGNVSEVQRHSLHAAERGRLASPTTTAYMLAHSGSCLAEIGRDIPRAEALLLEAQSIADRIGLETINIPFGLGYIRRHQGKIEEARHLLRQGWQKARAEEDHWRECTSLTNLVMLELDADNPSSALDYCSELTHVTAKMSEGSEVPHTAALDALVRYLLGENNAEDALERSRQTLHQIDSPRMLAYIQTVAAQMDLQQGRTEKAISRAEEALEAAQIVNNPSEIALAWAVIIQASIRLENHHCAIQHFAQLQNKVKSCHLNAQARKALSQIQCQLQSCKS